MQPHLVYDQTGTLVARDLWDGDHLPFDASFAQSPFYPQSHGSYVVDILRQSGLAFRLLPVRYPRPDMRLMGDAVAWLAAQKAHIVMMPLGSRSARDWDAFFAAAARHPDILFIISAGNNGLDLGASPIYPAVNNLPNALTVTSTLADGTLADGSNFGQAVDIGLPAENLLATGIGQQQRMMSGSSFAVPKLTGYAICIAHGMAQSQKNGHGLAAAVKASLKPAQTDGGYGLFLPDSHLTASCTAYQTAPK